MMSHRPLEGLYLLCVCARLSNCRYCDSVGDGGWCGQCIGLTTVIAVF